MNQEVSELVPVPGIMNWAVLKNDEDMAKPIDQLDFGFSSLCLPDYTIPPLHPAVGLPVSLWPCFGL